MPGAPISDLVDRHGIRDMHHVQRRARHARQRHGAHGGLRFRPGRARERVPLGRMMPLRECVFNQHVDGVAVLGMHHYHHARLGRLHKCLEQRCIVDLEQALIGHEKLERRDALRHDS